MKLSLLKLPLLIMQTFLGYLLFGVFFARTRSLPADFMDGFRQLVQQVERDPSCSLIHTQHRLLWWSKLFDPAGKQVMLVNFSSLRYFLSLGILEKLLAEWLPDLRKGAASLLCSGTEEVLSAEMGRGIWNLAKAVKKEPRLKALFEKEKPENIMDALEAMPESEKFRVMLRYFLSKNGHRGLKELELQSLRWEENPAPVLGMIRNYMLMETGSVEHERQVDRTRSGLETEIQNGLAHLAGERVFHFRWQPASPGSYEGTARVIMDPSIDVELRPGEILVAPYTDPAWTPLFLTAGAAVVEIGSYLSHAGTVAREFGMPCVVDLPGCTRFIHTGCRVGVDGDRGVVTMVERGGRGD